MQGLCSKVTWAVGEMGGFVFLGHVYTESSKTGWYSHPQTLSQL